MDMRSKARVSIYKNKIKERTTERRKLNLNELSIWQFYILIFQQTTIYVFLIINFVLSRRFRNLSAARASSQSGITMVLVLTKPQERIVKLSYSTSLHLNYILVKILFSIKSQVSDFCFILGLVLIDFLNFEALKRSSRIRLGEATISL